MLKISRQDYDSLWVKIQTAIKKVFSEFLEDPEYKTAGPGETGTMQEHQESELYGSTISGEIPPAAAGSKSHRMMKKATEVDRVLFGSTPAMINSPRKILEKDMKKQRKTPERFSLTCPTPSILFRQRCSPAITGHPACIHIGLTAITAGYSPTTDSGTKHLAKIAINEE